MMNIEEFRKTVARMFRSAQDSTFLLDDTKKPCKGVHCVDCPIFEETNTTSDECMINNLSIFDAFDIIEAVERWAKEHPIVTYEQKYEETFGVKPFKIDTLGNVSREYTCPKGAGFNIDVVCRDITCKSCKEKFWRSEYEPPVADKEEVKE